MTTIIILIIGALEHWCNEILVASRARLMILLKAYIEWFVSHSKIKTQRNIRFVYLFAAVPIVAIAIIIKLICLNHPYLYMTIAAIIFALCSDFLIWRESLRNNQDYFGGIRLFATKFFAPLFWFLVLPLIGPLCYLILDYISTNFKEQNDDSLIYNIVTDRMLFYANIIPYTILFFFVAIAGNFEETLHQILEQRKKFSKSAYFLDQSLQSIILLSASKNSFKLNQNNNDDDLEHNPIAAERFSPEITSYIEAVLYRSGLFFIGIIALVNIVAIIHY